VKIESKIDIDFKSLRSFVSDSIFQFLTIDTESTATPLPANLPTSSLGATGTSSTQLNLTDKELDELLLACSNSFKQPKNDPSLMKAPSFQVLVQNYKVLLHQKQGERYNRLESVQYQRRLRQTPNIV
jgi:hypothetical protein